MTFKDIPGWGNRYKITKCGKIWSNLKNRFLSLVIIHGYQKIELNYKGKSKQFFVHRLVCQCFLDNPENKSQVNHINGIKTDNRLENLEWCTPSENQKHMYRTGLRSQLGSKHNNSILTEDIVLIMRDLWRTNEYSLTDLSKIFDLNKGTIWDAVSEKGKGWRHV